MPYELITFDGHPFFGFEPTLLNPLEDVKVGDTFIPTDDYFFDDNVIRQEFDKIVGEVTVSSENVFLASQGHVSGYYDTNPSSEFGYPRE